MTMQDRDDKFVTYCYTKKLPECTELISSSQSLKRKKHWNMHKLAKGGPRKQSKKSYLGRPNDTATNCSMERLC